MNQYKSATLIKIINYLLLILLSNSLISCNYINNQDYSSGINDTIITYELEGISTEGAEAKVNYIDGKIDRSDINIYAGTWQAIIIYEFQTDKIKVFEKKYIYKTVIEDVNSLEDMQIDYEIVYFIDFNGSIIGKDMPNRIDIYKEFIKAVPFEINK